MTFGFTARMSSTSMPNFSRCPGRKLVRNTSAFFASTSSISRPSGTDMSSPMLRLPRLACSIFGLGSPSTLSGPVWRSPRCGSPVTACSILMTSAPHSASTAPADGTNPYMATSRTRIPSSGLIARSSSGLVPRPASSTRGAGSSLGLRCDHRRERLALDELLQAGLAHLASDPRLLVAAERCVGAEVVAAVDGERAGPDAPCHGQRAVLAAEDRARQTVDRVVGDAHRIVVVLIGDDGQHRAEHLFLRDLAVGVDIGQQRGGIEVSGVLLLAAGHQRGAGL